MEKAVAIITARGGSKRIPRKNIKEFAGKPMIAYPIQTALDSGIFDEVMVSTDDKEIADLAIRFGAKVPFFRSEANSDDYSGTAEVLLEVLDEYKKIGRNFQYCCCLYPTSPLLGKHRLIEAYRLLQENQLDSVFPVLRYSSPIDRSLVVNDHGFVAMRWPENLNKRSQDLPTSYFDAGQFYFLNVNSFSKTKELWMEKSSPIILKEMEAQDIDNLEDWEIAEFKYKYSRSLYGISDFH
ncbi:pseudaminic acid cytidylyltransferase [Leptospira kobayashii]|uniref:Pseudaminic acid cytidylyltransferase n=1 Tax=Leptospira kobayashii TaxID=1917830 RepID=A0ABN6KJ64_9LEPT|nr:pseudaminic acid cytidylyltransferase [Leptospira kobayashii]BDA79206.1 pseudaminic acid cytidylyltransferase [Leptospira kobayashii]